MPALAVWSVSATIATAEIDSWFGSAPSTLRAAVATAAGEDCVAAPPSAPPRTAFWPRCCRSSAPLNRQNAQGLDTPTRMRQLTRAVGVAPLSAPNSTVCRLLSTLCRLQGRQ